MALSPPTSDFAEAVGHIATLCRATDCIALANLSRRWQAALGREKAEIWRRYLADPAYLACPLLADDAVREPLLAGVHPWNLRLLVRSLLGPGWALRFVAVRRNLELGRLQAAAIMKPADPRPGSAESAQQQSAHRATSSRPARRRPASIVSACVQEAKRRRMSIVARRNVAAVADPSGEPALRAGLRSLEAAAARVEDCAQVVFGEVVFGILLPIRGEVGPGDPAAEAARRLLRQAVEDLGKLRPTAVVLRAARGVAALASLRRLPALARIDAGGGLRRACEELQGRWETSLSEDVLQHQWAQLAAARARRPALLATRSRLSRPGPRPQRRRSLALGRRPLRQA